MPLTGLMQGQQPLISYNYGARHFDRVKKIIKVSIISTAVILCCGTIIFMGLPELVLSWFNATEQLLEIGIIGLRVISPCFILSTMGVVISGVFESLGKGRQSLTISLLRQFIITLPLAYILLKVIGLNGIWLSFVIAEGIASVIAVILIKKELHNFKVD